MDIKYILLAVIIMLSGGLLFYHTKATEENERLNMIIESCQNAAEELDELLAENYADYQRYADRMEALFNGDISVDRFMSDLDENFTNEETFDFRYNHLVTKYNDKCFGLE